MDAGRRWLDGRSAAAYIAISYRTLLEWAADGTLGRGVVARIERRNSKGVGRHRVTLRFDRQGLDRFMESRAR